MVLLTIALPTYNRPAKLEKLVNQLLLAISSTKINVEVLIQDNSDLRFQNANKSIAKKCPNCEYEANPKNIGFGGNIQRLLAKCKTKYLLFLSDDDTLWVENFTDILESLPESQSPSLLMLPFTYGKNMSTIVNTKKQWKSAATLSGLYRSGSPFVLFSSCIFPIPLEPQKKSELNHALIPYVDNCFIQMILPIMIQNVIDSPLAIKYSDAPLVRYETYFEYNWPLKNTYASLNQVYELQRSCSLISDKLYFRCRSGVLRSHLLNVLQHKCGLRQIADAEIDSLNIAVKGLSSPDFKNFVLALTFFLLPVFVVKKILLFRGHSDSASSSVLLEDK